MVKSLRLSEYFFPVTSTRVRPSSAVVAQICRLPRNQTVLAGSVGRILGVSGGRCECPEEAGCGRCEHQGEAEIVLLMLEAEEMDIYGV